jgi:hypothetical protein
VSVGGTTDNNDSELYEDGKKPVVFYYNREQRVAKSPQIVKDYYSGKIKPQKGFIKVLVATPAKRILFFSIIALCILVIFLTFTMNSENEADISGIPVTLSAFAFEDVVYISIHLEENSRIRDTQAVFADISIFNADDEALEKRRLVKNYAGSEEFLRTTIADYDILRIEAVVSVSDAEATLKTAITRK